MSASSDTVIVGAAMTPFGRFPDETVRSLATAAVTEAIADAGLTAGDIGMIFFANAASGVLTGQEMIRGQSALRLTELLGTPIVNVENACASASSAFLMAVMAVRSGTVDVALAVGAEKLTHPDKGRSGLAIATAGDLSESDDGQRAHLQKALLGLDPPAGVEARSDSPSGSRFMDWYADVAHEYMASSGTTERDLAVVAAKNRSNAARNPKAQHREPTSAEDVMASREIVSPLRLLMCSPISDGAAAVVVCSADYAARLGAPAVSIEAVELVSGRGGNGFMSEAIERTAKRAYDGAGIGPDELNVLEVHDAAAPGEIMDYEELGLCGPGDGPKLLASGDTHLGGRMPVNPSGGLLGRGHPIGATGCAQIVELVGQLRGRAGDHQVPDARIALAQNGGGLIGRDAAASVVTILSRR
jgi:acetyl-CoA acetyltransferase